MLLQQLREITRVMKEGKFIDDISPEKEAEEAPYMADWEGKREPFLPLPLQKKKWIKITHSSRSFQSFG